MRIILGLSYLTLLTGCWIDKTRLCEGGASQTTLSCSVIKITDSTNNASAQFGAALSLLNDELLVGDPDGTDPKAGMTGLVRLFNLTQPARAPIFLSLPTEIGLTSYFGSTVEVSNSFACVGAPNRRSASVYCYSQPWSGTPLSPALTEPSNGNFGQLLAFGGPTLLVAMDEKLFFYRPDLNLQRVADLKLDSSATITSIALSGSRAVAFSSSTMNVPKLTMLTMQVGGAWEINPQDFPLLAGYKIPATNAKVAMSGTDLLVTLEPTGSSNQAVVHYSLESGVWSNPSVVLSDLARVTSLSIAGDFAAVGVEGAAWVLRRTCGKWESQKLNPNPPSSFPPSFGTAVSVSGSKVAVGAPTMGDPSVYVFTCN